MKYLLTLAAALMLSSAATAQYDQAIGFRGGFFSGITYKKFVSQDFAFEGILHTRYAGWQLTGLGEFHAQAFDVTGLNWYYGAGAHVGMFRYHQNSPYFTEESGSTVIGLGIDGILGIEYNIGSIPINVSLDWKPAFNLLGYAGFAADGGAFSVRYIF